MTALERQWVESEQWWRGILGSWIRRVGLSLLECSFDYPWGPQGSVWVNGVFAETFYGPHVATFDEAKADAEAMYRQWVYDTHGVVLP